MRAVLGALACWGTVSYGQVGTPPSSVAPVQGERLSDWLLRQPTDAQSYTTGVMWQVPGERDTQGGLKREVLVGLSLSGKASESARATLTQMVEALPVTGRVRVAIADARWLQAHPKDDPVLQRDHVVVLPRRPATVTVITNDGTRCTVQHRTGAGARDYVRACDPARAGRIDRAWVVQPDGSVHDFGIASWNEQAQDEAAPGAVIWAPARDSGWSPKLTILLTRFLATQNYDTILATLASADIEPARTVTPGVPARDAQITANDWGVIGLLQTPTARMAKAGEARFNYSRVLPYDRYNVLLQPFDWLETGFRYTNITNRLYGTLALSGDQQYKDKSVDFKVRLFEETAKLPQLAVGITDIGGTGLFSSEYVVANKRWGNFDWSLGIGWGNLGSSSNIRNPLLLLDRRFDTRGAATVSGGNISTSAFFRGPAALFGGLQYAATDKWIFKAEYDSNNYQNEPLANNQTQRTPINAGVVYRYHPAIDVSLGIERGNTLMMSFTLHTSLPKMGAPKVSDAPTPAIVAQPPTSVPIWDATVADIAAMSGGWGVKQIRRDGDVLKVYIEGAGGVHWDDRIERIAAVLHRDAPANIYAFEIIFIERGVALSARVILREPWVRKNLEYAAKNDRIEAIAAIEPQGDLPMAPPSRAPSVPPSRREDVVATAPRDDTPVGTQPSLPQSSAPTDPDAPLWEANRPRFGYGIVPSWQQSLGGPDGFLLFRAGVSTPFSLKVTEDTSISGSLTLGLLDNYDNFKYTAPSNLPRVRTFMREYMTTSRLNIPNLQITHFGKLPGNQYYSLYGGYLEAMYGGVGGEWLYRPWHSPVAFGVDANWVQQRSFTQFFGFGDAGTQTGYRTVTGHATAYWDTGWKSTFVKLSAGRYLAQDIGATLDVSKIFDNGVVVGAWATRTNVSAATFGEGSFDKGMYLRIPFDVMTTSRSADTANLVYNPLTRDGGARMNRYFTLYSATTARGKRDTGYRPATSALSTDDDAPLWDSDRSLFGDFVGSGLDLGGRVVRGQMGGAMLMSGGIVLGSSLLDRTGAKWADNHQGGRMDQVGKAASYIPLALAGGTGLLWWGLGGDGPRETAWTAIKSAAYTLMADTAMSYSLNRSRPDAGLGPTHFGPVGKSSGSLPSTHMSVAFAFVTPFAQDYDAPWLYAVAGATGFGRIQERKHYFSDVVAGSLLGYMTGTMLLDQQRVNRKGPKVGIGPNSITSSWDF